MSSFAQIYAEFCDTEDNGQRAVFDKAMEERVKREGLKVSDIVYEVFKCQQHIGELSMELQELQEVVDGLTTKKGKKSD